MINTLWCVSTVEYCTEQKEHSTAIATTWVTPGDMMLSKRGQTQTKMYCVVVEFHLCEVLWQMKLPYGDNSQNSGGLWGMGPGVREPWGTGNISCLDLGVGYTRAYICLLYTSDAADDWLVV